MRDAGCSNDAAWQRTKALGIADVRNLPSVVTTQNLYAPAFRGVEFEIWHQRMTAAHRYGRGDEAVPRLPDD